MKSKNLLVGCAVLLFLVSIYLVNWQQDRTEFNFLFSFFSLSFVGYLVLLYHIQSVPTKLIILVAVVANILALVHVPYLSIDYFRFLWDGELFWLGINPFDFTPEEIYNMGSIDNNNYLKEVYNGIGTMSQGHFSCYPPLNQSYFILATSISDSITLNTIVLKLMMLVTHFIGALYLLKLLKLFNIGKERIWLLYLNPLFIIECTGNTHFEGVMISFLFIAFYFIFSKKIFLGSTLFAVAVQIKLIPLMLLPFFLRFLGAWKSIMFYSLTIFLVIIFALLQINVDNYLNFGDSLRLYFEVFEFNSFILHYYVQFGIAETGWNLTKTYGPQLSQIALFIILALALYGHINDWKSLFKRATIAFFFYLILSSTVHPWYVIPLLALSIFTNYTFPLYWSFAVFFSYIFYAYDSNSAQEVRSIIDIEYVVLFLLFVTEIIRKKSPFKFLRLDRFIIKSP